MDGDETVLDALYAAVTRDDAFSVVLGLLATRFRCLSAVLLEIDTARPEMTFAFSWGIVADPGVQKRYLDSYIADDPAPGAMAGLPVGEVLATSQLFDTDYMTTSRFVQEFYYPLGLRETLGGPFVNGAGRLGILALHRGADRPAFTLAEIARFKRVLPHVARATKLRRAFFSIETQVRALGEVLETTTAAVLVFDASGLLRHANVAARTIVGRGDGFRLTRAGRLHLLDPDDDMALRRLLTGSSRTPNLLRVTRATGSPPYVLRVWPRSSGGWSLTVSDPGRSSFGTARALAQALGLSESAARLTMALLNGEDLATHARGAGISVNTAKFHLKAAFAATGCVRQSGLVRLAAEVVRDLALGEMTGSGV